MFCLAVSEIMPNFAQDFRNKLFHLIFGNMGKVKLNGCEDYEFLCNVVLDSEKFPKAYSLKMEELVSECGMSEEEAREYIMSTPIELELYYSPSNGCFAVESDAVEGGCDIYDPYTGEACEGYDWE